MSKGAHDVFGLVISFLNEEWEPQHITIGLNYKVNYGKKFD
jgi:hypothetical protein